MGIVKLLRILGPEATILTPGSGEPQSALDLATMIERDPSAHPASGDYTISNGYIYRVDGNDSLARKPFGQIVQSGNIPADNFEGLDVGGQLWRELKRLNGEL